MVRGGLGVLGGGIVWYVGFFVLAQVPYQAWPAYAEAARFMFEQDDLSHFTTPMLFLNWAVFIGTGTLAGWLSRRIALNRIAPLVVGLVWLVYAVVNHYWLVWNELPDWYNLIVPFVIGLPILAWSRFPRGATTMTSA